MFQLQSQLYFGKSYIKFLLQKNNYYLRNMDGLLEILKYKAKFVFGKKTIIISLPFTIRKKRAKENKIFLEMQVFNSSKYGRILRKKINKNCEKS